MEQRPVNTIQGHNNTIKVNDLSSQIKLIIKDGNDENVSLENKIEYFYLYKDNKKFFPVDDIEFTHDGLLFRIPPLRRGLYKIEIKDTDGHIYPAGDDVEILLIESFDGGKEAKFITMKDSVIESVEPIIINHIEENPEKFKGEQGIQGPKGDKGDRGEQGIQGLKGDKGDKGDKGEQGIQGLKGDKGDRGEQGIQGLKGDKGDRGEQGIQGLKGDKGIDGNMINGFVGTENIFNMSDITLFSTGEIINNYENGIIKLINTPHYFTTDTIFDKGDYVISVLNVSNNSPIYPDVIRPQIFNTRTNEMVFDIGRISGIKPFKITEEMGLEDDTYYMRIYISGGNLELDTLCEIEKLMLVNGNATAFWKLSDKDKEYIKGVE